MGVITVILGVIKSFFSVEVEQDEDAQNHHRVDETGHQQVPMEKTHGINYIWLISLLTFR